LKQASSARKRRWNFSPARLSFYASRRLSAREIKGKRNFKVGLRQMTAGTIAHKVKISIRAA
ncbi:MAG: hypothetical protein IKL39_02530, partial [Mailhella sp.]|nr:hypothetical protein [Mailhella sp.]